MPYPVPDRAVRLTATLSPGHLVRCIRLSVANRLGTVNVAVTEALSEPIKRSKKSWDGTRLGAFDCQ